jgi:tagatose 1,6-diphosphate aldolase/sulfofructosephosphate aldolase
VTALDPGGDGTGGLDRIATPDGTFAIVAMDQRNTLRRMYEAAGLTPDPGDMVALKADIARALSPSASALLVDPDLGVPALAGDGVLAPGCGVLVAAEPAEKQSWQGEPRATRDPSLDAAWVRGHGGDALKFLVQLRAGRPHRAGGPDLVEELLEVVRAVVADCRAAGVPSVVENLVYRLPGEEALTGDARAEAVVESARLLDGLGCDLLKLEYPGSPAACRRLADAVTGPWAVLSAGVPFDDFLDAVRVSCDEGGASGFIAGRAFWKEAVALPGPQRAPFLAEHGRPRLDACVAALAGRARPWREARRAAA